MPVLAVLIYEWQGLHEPFSLRRFLPLLFGGGLVLSAYFGALWSEVAWISTPVLFGFLLIFFFVEGLLRYRPGLSVLEDISRRFLGVVYCALPLGLLLEIRHAEQGGQLICFLLLTVWVTDAGAYFVGRQWGKRKLSPHISPGKTLAGFWGGVGLAGITGGGMAYGFSLPFGWLEAFFLCSVLSVVGQVGDLAESLLKREAGVKDSGRLIPGHGGMLDRLDSLLFAVPVFYVFLLA